MAVIRVFGPRDKHLRPPIYINTTSTSDTWSIGLSPFLLGPVALYDGMVAMKMENAWQYAKVYDSQVDVAGNPTDAYWAWAKAGWNNPRGVRYPMGKGAKPLYSLWKGQHLDYISARKQIYAPLYAGLVVKTEAFCRLKEMRDRGEDIWLWDFDGYDNELFGMSYEFVLNNPSRTMGHAFIIAMLLNNQQLW